MVASPIVALHDLILGLDKSNEACSLVINYLVIISPEIQGQWRRNFLLSNGEGNQSPTVNSSWEVLKLEDNNEHQHFPSSSIVSAAIEISST